MSSRRRLHGQQGASLILALVFLTLFSVVAVSTLSLTGVSFRNTDVTRTRVDQLYAADGGIEYGIRQLATTEPPLCPDSSDSLQPVGAIQLNGKTVTVECRTTQVETSTIGGASPLLGGYTAIITGSNGPTTPEGYGIDIHGNTNNGSPPSEFLGNVYSAGRINAPEPTPVTVDGNLELGPPQACPPLPENVSVTDGNTCTGNQPLPTVPVPDVVIPDSAAPQPQTSDDCTVFYPGKYTSAPNFQANRQYYLASGTYYFQNTGDINLRGVIFGGAPGSDPQQATSADPCATDETAEELRPNQYEAASAGSGVTIIMGGNSVFRAQPNSSVVELHTRVPAAGSPDRDATPGVTIWARTDSQGVHASGGTYVPASQVPFRTQGKASVVVLHGLAYLPQSGAVMREPLNDNAQGASVFLGGVIAKYLEFDFQGNSPAPPIATIAGSGVTTTVTTPVTTVLVARAETTTGGTDTVVTAVVDRPTSDIKSWRQT